jgi:hypothetical protein
MLFTWLEICRNVTVGPVRKSFTATRVRYLHNLAELCSRGYGFESVPGARVISLVGTFISPHMHCQVRTCAVWTQPVYIFVQYLFIYLFNP